MCLHCVGMSLIALAAAWQAWQLGLRVKAFRWWYRFYDWLYYRAPPVWCFLVGHGKPSKKFSGGTYCSRCWCTVRK